MRQKISHPKTLFQSFFALCFTLSTLSPFPVLAAETSFKKVTSQLDSGGEFFAYQNTARWADKMTQGLHSLQNILWTIPDLESQLGNPEQISKTVDLFVKISGLQDLNGIGMSSIAVEEGVYRNKILFHHEKGQPEGALWKCFGTAAHLSDGLTMAPSTTAALSFVDMDLLGLWNLTQDLLIQTGNPQAKTWVESVPALSQMFTGVPLDALLASLGGTYGIILTLDETKKINIPMGPGKTVEIPEPTLSILIKVKDDQIFNLIAPFTDNAPGVIKVDEAGLKMRTVPVPLPLPITLRPTVVRAGEYLIFSTTDAAVQELLAVGAGKKDGLKKGPEFMKLSKEISKEGNHFFFVSEAIGRLVYSVMEAQTAAAPDAPNSEQQKNTLKTLFQEQEKSFSFSVSQNTEQGWLTTMNSSQPLGGMMIGWKPILGIVAAVGIPGIVAAREKAKITKIKDHLMQMDIAKEQWASANQKQAGDPVTLEEITSFFPTGVAPAAIDGEVYALNSIGTPASATLSKKLAENPVGAVLMADSQPLISQPMDSQAVDSEPIDSESVDSQTVDSEASVDSDAVEEK